MLLRHWVENDDCSLSEAARELGVHRGTLHRWIAAGLLDQDVETIKATYKARPPVPTKLDPVKALIQARLVEFPELSAQRLLVECQAAGYTGGYTQLSDYVRTLRPAPIVEPVVRFETAPGHQAQVDFAHCRLPWGVRYALVVVLAYSRLLWVRFYPRQDLATLVHGLSACFTEWGGVVRECLFDQMKSVLTRDDRLSGGGLVTNLECQRFANHYGFKIRVCRPYRAKTKGKVERPIRYLRENFLYGRRFVSDADLNAQAMHWLATVANTRTHGTTHVVPLTRFDEERGRLQPLPTQPYRSLLLTAPPVARPVVSSATHIDVEHRDLAAYAALAGGPG
jgi:transposase